MVSFDPICMRAEEMRPNADTLDRFIWMKDF